MTTEVWSGNAWPVLNTFLKALGFEDVDLLGDIRGDAKEDHFSVSEVNRPDGRWATYWFPYRYGFDSSYKEALVNLLVGLGFPDGLDGIDGFRAMRFRTSKTKKLGWHLAITLRHRDTKDIRVVKIPFDGSSRMENEE